VRQQWEHPEKRIDTTKQVVEKGAAFAIASMYVVRCGEVDGKKRLTAELVAARGIDQGSGNRYVMARLISLIVE
jgi:hypothetical protein